MSDSYSIVEQRDGFPPRVLVEVDGTREAEALVNDLLRRQHRVHLVRGRDRDRMTLDSQQPNRLKD